MADIGQPAGQSAGGGLADLFGNVNRPALNSFVATSQARNGLVSAQTQDALIKAQQAQESQDAYTRLPQELVDANPGMKQSDALLTRDILVHLAGGDPVNAGKFVAQMKLMYGNPGEQTAGQQGFEGKIAPPVATPPVSQTPAAPPGGSALGPVTVSPMGRAQIGNLNATAGLHTEQANNPGAFHPGAAPMDPQAIQFGAYMLYKTGKMPALGMGSGPARSQILAGAAQLANQEAQGQPVSNPGFDTALANGQDFTAGQRSLSNFAGGPLGNQTRSINNVVGHLQLMEGLFNGLQNGDVQVANKLGAQWNKAFGSPVPTNIQTAAEFIGPELTKILSANGSTGTAEERQGFANTAANLANSPEQTAGAIGTLKGMLGRQLMDMALQYHGATGRSDFASRYVAPDVAQYLDVAPQGGPAQTPAPGATPLGSRIPTPTTSPTTSASPAGGNASALPPQALAQLKDGIHTTFGNGQVWTIQNGKPVRVQ